MSGRKTSKKVQIIICYYIQLTFPAIIDNSSLLNFESPVF